MVQFLRLLPLLLAGLGGRCSSPKPCFILGRCRGGVVSGQGQAGRAQQQQQQGRPLEPHSALPTGRGCAIESGWMFAICYGSFRGGGGGLALPPTYRHTLYTLACKAESSVQGMVGGGGEPAPDRQSVLAAVPACELFLCWFGKCLELCSKRLRKKNKRGEGRREQKAQARRRRATKYEKGEKPNADKIVAQTDQNK